MVQPHKKIYTIELTRTGEDRFYNIVKDCPIRVVRINGRHVKNDTKQFNTDAILSLITDYPKMIRHGNPNIANKIIEYIDQHTGQVIVTVFPTTTYISPKFRINYLDVMTPEMRSDLQYQISLREQIINNILAAENCH